MKVKKTNGTKTHKMENASWIIRYIKTAGEEATMESRIGKKEDVERYAAAKAKVRGCDYIVA